MDKLDEELLCHALIKALPDDFKQFSLTLIITDRLKKEDITTEETRCRRSLEEAAANAARVSARALSAPNAPKHYCAHCKKSGHSFERCFHNPAHKAKRPAWFLQQNPGFAAYLATTITTTTASANLASSQASPSPSQSQLNAHFWNTDTGATAHMTPHRQWFTDYRPHRVRIQLADSRDEGHCIYSHGIGSISFIPELKGIVSPQPVIFTDVLHVPELANNLFSVLSLVEEKGFTALITKGQILYHKSGKLLFTSSTLAKNRSYLNLCG